MLNLDNRITYILEILNEYGKAYLVGGAIRDLLLGRIPKDIDLATDISMYDLINILKEYNPIIISERYNVLRINIEGLDIEIARFRKEYGILDGRNPIDIEFTYDIREDLKRRDFTINAMAYNLKEGLIDEYNSKKDLENKVIRIIGDDKKIRFCEDNSRILRAIGLISKYDFELEKETYDAISEVLKQKKLNISNDKFNRIMREILFNSYSYKSIKLMIEIDLFKKFIPELDKNKLNKEILNQIYNSYKVYCRYNMQEEQSIGFAILFIYLGKMVNEVSYIIESVCIADKNLKKFDISLNEILLIKNLIYYSEIIFKNINKINLKRMLLEFGNNSNISKLLNLISFINHYREDYKEIVNLILKLLSKIQDVYFKGEILFINDLDINIVDLYNLNLDKNIYKENLRQLVYNEVNEGKLKNDKEEILKFIKNKYNLNIQIKKTSCAGAVIFRYEKDKLKFLLVKINGGNWGFSKGHVEKNETLKQTAIREAKEETGLDVVILESTNFNSSISYIVEDGEIKNVTFFIAEAFSDKVIIDEKEISEYRWVSYVEALKLLTYSSQKDVLKKARLHIFI